MFFYELVLVVTILGKSAFANEDINLAFPPDFLFGVSTAAYQIEGAWNADGKGESVWDRFSHKRQNRIHNNDTGDIAANSYQLYKDDVKLIDDIGFKAYRFSVSWSRILPDGFTHKINKKGIDYYNNLINELLAKNITPMITLLHFDHPQVIDELGGWTNEEIVGWFGDYARIVFREYGDRVKMFVTINEPGPVCYNSYSTGCHAPGKKIPGIGEYICGHNMLKAHARAYHIYQDEFKSKQNGSIGIVENLKQYYNKFDNDTESAEIAFQFDNGWMLHPIFSKTGDYPKVMKDIIKRKSEAEGYEWSRLPEFSSYWIDYIRGSADFLGINHYTSWLVEPGGNYNGPSQVSDRGVIRSPKESWKPTVSSWLHVAPEGFGDLLRKLASEYDNPLMIVTENGVADLGGLDDDHRIQYYHDYLREMLIAINRDKINVKGYFIWSLLDNFEWAQGYNEKFGIVAVDFQDPTRPRTKKKSANWWNLVLSLEKLKPPKFASEALQSVVEQCVNDKKFCR